MITAGMLKFDPEGRVILSTSDPVTYGGGTPIAADGGLSAALDVVPDVFNNALGYFNNGKLTNSNNPLIPGAGVLSNRLGQVRISTELPAFWYAGLPLTVDGHLAISPGVVPPPDEGAFSNAFSNAFDALEP